MTNLDYVTLILYFLGIFGVGLMTMKKNRSSEDMFAAGGDSPWWVSGTSAFMSMFSAGTFVVWGGIAYRYGAVAILISLCYGVAALVVGKFIAGRWNEMKLTSPAEFIELRFGRGAVQFYMWLQVLLVFAGGAAVYGLSKLLCALIVLPSGHLLADPATGTLSVTIASVAIVAIVVIYTMLGGLWAVLMTDVLQFIILTVAVMFVVPLILAHDKVGGISGFIDKAPEGFLSPTTGEFTWFFLGLWTMYHVINIGANWSFAQRFICVPTKKDARKASYLFGILYLVSPLIWLLPPMVYRIIDPGADHEQAYILACSCVLPAGMIGLMMAAMFSATASMADTSFNVMAGALMTEVYQKYIKKEASDRHYVFAGRVITVLLGVQLLGGALLIPRIGTYTGFILALALIKGALLLPTIWGLFSRKVGLSAVYVTALVAGPTGILMKFGLAKDGWFANVAALQSLAGYYQANMRVADILVGIGTPVLVLLAIELLSKGEHEGWTRTQARIAKHEPAVSTNVIKSRYPAFQDGGRHAWISLGHHDGTRRPQH